MTSDRQSRWARPMRHILRFLKEAGRAQVQQIPGVGPTILGVVSVVEKMSEEEAAREMDAQIERLTDVAQRTNEDLQLLTELSMVSDSLQMENTGLLLEIRHMLTARVPSTEIQQFSQASREAALDAYMGRLVQDHMYVDYRGIYATAAEDYAVALPLDEVYVHPMLRPEHETRDNVEQERHLIRQLDDLVDMREQERGPLEEQLAVLRSEHFKPGSQDGGSYLLLDQALEQSPQFVIMGGPGTGKSTLVRYMTLQLALGEERTARWPLWAKDLMPIRLSLAEFADARVRKAGLTLEDFVQNRMAQQGHKPLLGAYQTALDQGKVCFLLDGVDEIPDPAERAAIVGAIDRFISDRRNQRIVVTSRPAGYVRLANIHDHYILPNFSEGQVSDFVHKWQRAFEIDRHQAAPNIEHAESEAKNMLEEIGRHSKVSELCSNPLMLVIVALVRYEGGRLPGQRVALYQRAVNTLLETWNRFRSSPDIDLGGVILPRPEMQEVWGAVAEWMHRKKPTGFVYRAELKQKLIEVLKDREYDDDRPEFTADSYLNAAVERHGLLEERAPDIFAFGTPPSKSFWQLWSLPQRLARPLSGFSHSEKTHGGKR
jgi:hypothetical protein